jgi:hypothetical protein
MSRPAALLCIGALIAFEASAGEVRVYTYDMDEEITATGAPPPSSMPVRSPAPAGGDREAGTFLEGHGRIRAGAPASTLPGGAVPTPAAGTFSHKQIDTSLHEEHAPEAFRVAPNPLSSVANDADDHRP